MHTDDSYRQLVAKAIAFFEEKGLKNGGRQGRL